MDLSLFSFLVYILLTIHNLSVPAPNNEVDIFSFYTDNMRYGWTMDVITISPQSEMMKTILDIINIMEYKFGK